MKPLFTTVMTRKRRIGEPCKMVFDYTKFFMGSKFAIFNYATKDLGGYVDIDYFEYGN